MPLTGLLPTDLANCELWLRGDTGFFQDDAATVPATAQADPLAVWQDQTASVRHATQTVAGDRPKLEVTGALNGKKVVRFNNSNTEFFNLPNFLTGFTYGEIFCLIKSVADPLTAGFNQWRFGSDGANADYHPWSDGVMYEGWGSTARKTPGNASTPLNEWHLLHIVSKAGLWRMQLNFGEFYSTGTNTVGWTTAPTLGKGLGALYYDGYMADVFMFSTEKTVVERSGLIYRLTEEYGVPMAQTYMENDVIDYPNAFGVQAGVAGFAITG